MSTYIPPTPPSRKNKKHNRKKVIPLPENCWVDQPDILPEFCCKIELSRGLFAIVDEDDFEFLNQFTWSVKPDGGTCYAVTNSNKTEYKMHRVVMKVNNGKEIMIDHINHNGLDNRKSNLRIASNSENQGNRRERTKKKNRFIGVLPGLVSGFTVWVRVSGKKTKKNFQDEVEAARYYDYKIVQERGPDTKTNISDGRFTQEELESFGGRISNPLEETKVIEDIRVQENMVCMTPLEFKKIVHQTTEKKSGYQNLKEKVEQAEARVKLLEETLRLTEADLSRANQQLAELGI